MVMYAPCHSFVTLRFQSFPKRTTTEIWKLSWVVLSGWAAFLDDERALHVGMERANVVVNSWRLGNELPRGAGRESIRVKGSVRVGDSVLYDVLVDPDDDVPNANSERPIPEEKATDNNSMRLRRVNAGGGPLREACRYQRTAAEA